MLLFLGQLPPPIHGASAMNKKAHDAIMKAYPSTISINISNADSLDDIGSASLSKIIKISFLLCKILHVLLVYRPTVSYFSFCPSGKAFYRDVTIVAMLKLFRVKRILHLHGRGIKASKSKIKRALYKFSFNDADVIHLSSLFWGEVDGLVKKERFWVVPNCGIDLVKCIKPNTDGEVINFYYLSNFVRGKGALYLLQAAENLYEQKVNCRISLAGGWSDLNLKEEIEQWTVKNSELVSSGFVSFYGALYDQNKIDFIAQGDVLVFPSYIDTFPLVVIEALSAGKAVIASETGAVPEMLSEGECGIIFPEHDVAALIQNIKLLAADKSLVRKLGDSGRRRYEALYQEACFNDALLNTIKKISPELS